MNWEHFDELKIGELRLCAEGKAGQDILAGYVLDSVSTGRTRVFRDYRLSVFVGDADYVGTDPRSLREAVLACAEKLADDGLRMRIAAVAEGFSESGMSFNTGWGYLPGVAKAVHMMDFYAAPESTPDVS